MTIPTSVKDRPLTKLIETIQSVVVIDSSKLELILASMLAGGHVLLEDVPGIGKTMIAKAIAQSVDASFKRIQCTPDLLPSDITGGAIYNQREQTFDFVKGAIFANIVLVDEINRASPRTQSSLLEAMAEGQVTSDGYTHMLPQPFFIIATQNPIEMAGTFPLPEAQLDRFLISINMGYPTFEDEVTILEREEHENPLEHLKAQIHTQDLLDLQVKTRQINVSRSLKEYIVHLTNASRTHADVVLGISPRAGVALQRCAQALALLRGREFVTPDDIKHAIQAVAPHRILTRDRSSEGARNVVQSILQTVRVPLE
jgi:MoxR-like ATPase